MGAMTDERKHWRRLLETHSEELQVLELRAASFGDVAVPPLIVTWIQDLKEEIAELEAKLAAAPPPPVPVPEAPPAEPGEEQPTPDRLPFEPEMILIPAGEFLMGSDRRQDKDARDDEQPQHTLYLPDYTIAKTPVTNAQYAEFVRDAGVVAPPGPWRVRDAGLAAPPEHWREGESPRDKLDHPVVCVSWRDAVAYCDWLVDITGKLYRLPSEAEWEKAARGTDGRIYPWGNRWYPGWCNTLEGGMGGTTPVGKYPQGASPYGLLDMAGNVWEWCSSLYQGYPYGAGDGREDLEALGARVIRGGSWGGRRLVARCACRDRLVPDLRGSILGFRVCVVSRQD